MYQLARQGIKGFKIRIGFVFVEKNPIIEKQFVDNFNEYGCTIILAKYKLIKKLYLFEYYYYLCIVNNICFRILILCKLFNVIFKVNS